MVGRARQPGVLKKREGNFLSLKRPRKEGKFRRFERQKSKGRRDEQRRKKKEEEAD